MKWTKLLQNQNKIRTRRSSNWCFIATLHNYPFNKKDPLQTLSKSCLIETYQLEESGVFGRLCFKWPINGITARLHLTLVYLLVLIFFFKLRLFVCRSMRIPMKEKGKKGRKKERKKERMKEVKKTSPTGHRCLS